MRVRWCIVHQTVFLVRAAAGFSDLSYLVHWTLEEYLNSSSAAHISAVSGAHATYISCAAVHSGGYVTMQLYIYSSASQPNPGAMVHPTIELHHGGNKILCV